MRKITENELSKIDGYQPRKERVKQFSGNLLVWINLEGYLESTSYGWWEIVHNKNGLYFFNWYSYSNSTRKHQWKMSRIMKQLGLDYISVSYSGQRQVESGYGRNTLQNVSIEQILQDKINELYTGENRLSLSRATKYSVYSEDDFNQTLSDIRKIAAAMKISNDKLDKMLLEAEDKANNELIETLVSKHEKDTLRRQLRKENESLAAISL
jgi:hypothetical protein